MKYGSYGSSESVFSHGKRRRMNLLAIFFNLLVPWLIFCAVFSAMSFTLHYQFPLAAKAVVLCGLLFSIFAFYLGYKAKQRDADPMWYNFAGCAILVATVIAAVCGDMNYWYNMQTLYDLENLNTYTSVNPRVEKGQQLMDAGRVYFSAGATLDTQKTIAFKNENLYCVAPIVEGTGKLASYDYWAVGINCCSGVSSDFRCGEFNNPHARSGLRLMRDDQRPFFRLAVQQAEAAYNIHSAHPLFFFWLQDPVAEMNSYKDDGFKYLLIAIFSHFIFNSFCVVSATIGFSKIGR